MPRVSEYVCCKIGMVSHFTIDSTDSWSGRAAETEWNQRQYAQLEDIRQNKAGNIERPEERQADHEAAVYYTWVG